MNSVCGTGVIVKSSFYVLLGPRQVYVTCSLAFPLLCLLQFSSVKQTYLAT